MTTIKRIPPKSIYNQYEAQQQEQRNVVFEENKHQINTSLKSSVEQDSMNITNSISSEHQNNQVSEVKQEKRPKQINIYSMKNKAHGGVFKTFTDPSDDTKMIEVYRDGYKVEYDIINKTKRILKTADMKQLEDEMNKFEDEINLIRNKLGLTIDR